MVVLVIVILENIQGDHWQLAATKQTKIVLAWFPNFAAKVSLSGLQNPGITDPIRESAAKMPDGGHTQNAPPSFGSVSAGP